MTSKPKDSSPFDFVIGKLEAAGCRPQRTSDGQRALCPAHDDRKPSLDIWAGDIRVVLTCWANCPEEDICAELGISKRDLFHEPAQGKGSTVREHRWLRADGTLAFVHLKRTNGAWRYKHPCRSAICPEHREPAEGGWCWKKPAEADSMLWDMPHLEPALEAGADIIWTAGEKDAQHVSAELIAMGIRPDEAVATAVHQGEKNKVTDGQAALFDGFAGRVTLYQDRDPTGINHTLDRLERLQKLQVETVAKVVPGPVLQDKAIDAVNDMADYLAAGGHLSDLREVTTEELRAALEGGRRIRLTRAADITPKPTHWLWKDRLPVGVVALTPGRGGIGKSTFHAWAVAHVTLGTLPGIFGGEPQACIIVAAEDSWERTIVPRLMAAGADLDLVYRADVVTDDISEGITLSLPRDCADLERAIHAHKVALVSVDPLLSVVDFALDTYKDRDMRRVLEPLGGIADRTNCVFLGNAHFNKSGGSDPLNQVMGSAAFGNVVRAAIGFAWDQDNDERVLSQVKNNLGRMDLPSLSYRLESATVETPEGDAEVARFVLGVESETSVSDVLAGGGQGQSEGGTAAQAAVWLSRYLAEHGGRVDAGDGLAAAVKAGFAERTVKRARRDAGIVTHKVSGGWEWSFAPVTESGKFLLQGAKGPGATTQGHLGPLSPSRSAKGGSEDSEPASVTEGKCAQCHEPIIRYGPGGSPLCDDCRAEEASNGSSVVPIRRKPNWPGVC